MLFVNHRIRCNLFTLLLFRYQYDHWNWNYRVTAECIYLIVTVKNIKKHWLTTLQKEYSVKEKKNAL
jgi:hypothetical protein